MVSRSPPPVSPPRPSLTTVVGKALPVTTISAHALTSRQLQVCTGSTGYAEAVQFEYDPAETDYKDLASFASLHPCLIVQHPRLP